MSYFRITMGLVTLTLLATGCATTFVGSAYVQDGRSGCETKCRDQGMELTGMIYMGEYSDACVCSLPGQSALPRPSDAAAAGAVVGSSAAVATQMQSQQQRQHR